MKRVESNLPLKYEDSTNRPTSDTHSLSTMWNKLSEYAEGIAEIVAQADATAAAAVAADGTSAASSTQSPPRSSKGEEIWSRFASIVAPPATAAVAAVSGSASSAPLSQRSAAAIASATGGSSESAAAVEQQQLERTSARAADEDEQEQYICELERALLQRKKQNEALEKRAYELEFRLDQQQQEKVREELDAVAMCRLVAGCELMTDACRTRASRSWRARSRGFGRRSRRSASVEEQGVSGWKMMMVQQRWRRRWRCWSSGCTNSTLAAACCRARWTTQEVDQRRSAN